MQLRADVLIFSKIINTKMNSSVNRLVCVNYDHFIIRAGSLIDAALCCVADNQKLFPIPDNSAKKELLFEILQITCVWLIILTDTQLR